RCPPTSSSSATAGRPACAATCSAASPTASRITRPAACTSPTPADTCYFSGVVRQTRPRVPRTTIDIAELLRTVALFASLTLTQRELIARTVVARQVRRGELVVDRGATCVSLSVVARV